MTPKHGPHFSIEHSFCTKIEKSAILGVLTNSIVSHPLQTNLNVFCLKFFFFKHSDSIQWDIRTEEEKE